MSLKKESPPPRPPAPNKVSLAKLRSAAGSKQHGSSAMSSVSIRFNPRFNEDDDDLSLEVEENVAMTTKLPAVRTRDGKQAAGVSVVTTEGKTSRQDGSLTPATQDSHKDGRPHAATQPASSSSLTSAAAAAQTSDQDVNKASQAALLSPSSSVKAERSQQSVAVDSESRVVVGHIGSKKNSSAKTGGAHVVGHIATHTSSHISSDARTTSSKSHHHHRHDDNSSSVNSSAVSRGFMKPSKAEIVASTATADMEKKSSLLADIKGKFSDKFVDPLTAALREKIEELSSESSPEEDRPPKTRDFFSKKRMSSLDEQQGQSSVNVVEAKKVIKQGSLDALSSDLLNDKDTREAKLSMSKPFSKSDNSIIKDKPDSGKDVFCENQLEHDDSFENVEFAEEHFEAFDGAVNLSDKNFSTKKSEKSKSSSTEKLEQMTGKSVNQTSSSTNSQKHKLPPLLSGRGGQNSPRSNHKPIVPGGAVPVVSLSSLLSQKEEDDDLVFTPESADKNEKFFSPAEVPPSPDVTKQKIPVTDIDQPSLTLPTKPIPVQRFAVLTTVLFVYLVLPLPTYLSGVIMGAVLASVGWVFWVWITAPPTYKPPVVIADLDSLPPLQVPEMRDSRNEDGKFKGWVNELDSYDPDDYHINKTHSIYIQLEGTILRLQRPRQNISRRAMWDDPHFSAQFVHQRHFDLTGSKVYLKPDGLVKKRVWSKKYPICINLDKNDPSTPGKSTTNNSSSSALTEEQKSSAKNLGFEIISKESCSKNILYIFARTGREKEEWFRRFEAASSGNPLPCKLSSITKPAEAKVRHSSSSEFTLRHRRQGSTESTSSTHSEPSRDQAEVQKDNSHMLSEYLQYMGKIMPAGSMASSKNSSSPLRTMSNYNSISCEPSVIWTNALIGRCFWDFLRSKHWEGKVSEKIQKKLSKIHVPYFMDELTVTGIDLGSEIPTIRRISRPYIDERGLWIDLDLAYNGGFIMSLETKVNLMKLKKTKSPSKKNNEKRSPVTDSEEEDSAESSSDEDADEKYDEAATDDAGSSSGKGKKIWRIVDKITQSKYFQQATEYKYIKKAMEEVSNTRLMLTVSVQSLVGSLAVNIPAPPTDRLWYGFRTNPRLVLSAKPKVGEREVTVTHVTEWIEKKLAIEFQRIVVMPNMDDIPIPLMLAQMNDSSQSTTTASS